jgi:hypothetical protein
MLDTNEEESYLDHHFLAHTRKITGTASRLAIILAYLEYII